ncbi:MAG: Fe-S cluster assembly protein HesB [Arenimonas sp. SCN 70-307]|uniref:HesB/IscA family protein n=1 Tax=Arenimonas sp. SCN 70-307 TaxID=1660089 RepID=UPI00086F3172|nr:iron-sulfur cluster assembly accessory protein [Arenimonas sp. SCN 70-307]ODS62367.1 MAG: Fe-S cluster assembly protein HesB [Arenimonas sp. SCN 70-307]
MAITLTPAAANRIRSYQADSPGTLGLRFGVRKSGCTGFAYVIDMASEAGPDDHVFESAGVKVFVDADSLPQVDGTEIDFASQGLNQQFVFRNPNVEDACGCGESFSTRA